MLLIFFSLFCWFSFSFVLKIHSTLKMFLLSVQNNYIEFICRRAYAKKIILNFMALTGLKASKIWLFFYENLLQSKFSVYFQAEKIPWIPMFLGFLTEFHMIWKNQESCECWFVRFSVRRHSKSQKLSQQLFLCFWAAIMDLLITLKY